MLAQATLECSQQWRADDEESVGNKKHVNFSFLKGGAVQNQGTAFLKCYHVHELSCCVHFVQYASASKRIHI